MLEKLIQTVGPDDIHPDDSFFKHPNQSVVNFGGLYRGFEGTMVINDDEQPYVSKYVSIEIKKYIDFETHLSCGFNL